MARLAFVREEHRNPTIAEPSVPPYVASSMRGNGAMPAFASMRDRWPAVVASRNRRIVVDRPFTASDLRPFVAWNYEAQQPSLYYTAAAPLGGGSAVRELRAWRLAAALFALAIVIATAAVAFRWFGTRGILAAAMIVSMPTWLTLVLRAGNDAPACALAAIAIAISASAPRRVIGIVAEAVAWAAAVAMKLYVWPIAIVFPLFWRIQRGSRWRLAAVTFPALVVAGLTARDLASRTLNPLGDFGFDSVPHTAAAVPIDWFAMVKIEIASFIWTSGQHADALKSGAMLLYFGPIAIAVCVATVMSLRRTAAGDPARRALAVAFAAVVTFAIAQLVNAGAFVRQARAAGLALPLGGKEGWYWYTLAPLFAGVFLSLVMRRWRVVAFWIVAWDVVITESALFHDWAGTASPAQPSILFRWGPFHAPFTASLDGIGIGPLTSHLVLLRFVHLGALAALFALESFLHTAEDDDRNAPAPA